MARLHHQEHQETMKNTIIANTGLVIPRRRFLQGAGMAMASVALGGIASATGGSSAGYAGHPLWYKRNSWIEWNSDIVDLDDAVANGEAALAFFQANPPVMSWKEEGCQRVFHPFATGASSSRVISQPGSISYREVGGCYQYGIMFNAIKFFKKPDGSSGSELPPGADFDTLFNNWSTWNQ
jgi:hypothetical protein